MKELEDNLKQAHIRLQNTIDLVKDLMRIIGKMQEARLAAGAEQIRRAVTTTGEDGVAQGLMGKVRQAIDAGMAQLMTMEGVTQDQAVSLLTSNVLEALAGEGIRVPEDGMAQIAETIRAAISIRKPMETVDKGIELLQQYAESSGQRPAAQREIRG